MAERRRSSTGQANNLNRTDEQVKCCRLPDRPEGLPIQRCYLMWTEWSLKSRWRGSSCSDRSSLPVQKVNWLAIFLHYYYYWFSEGEYSQRYFAHAERRESRQVRFLVRLIPGALGLVGNEPTCNVDFSAYERKRQSNLILFQLHLFDYFTFTVTLGYHYQIAHFQVTTITSSPCW